MRSLTLLVLLVALARADAWALWFPLRTEPANPNHGLTDFYAAWAAEHRFGFLHGCGATPVAPRWIITAGHLQGQRIFDYKMGAHGHGSHHIVETIPHPEFPRVDLRLYRVKETIVDYAAIAKARPATNDVLMAYGRGKAAPLNPFKLNDQIIGWKLHPWTNGVDGLRAGELTRHTYQSTGNIHTFSWNFADGPMTAYGDSGHPVFHGHSLAGILFAAPAHVYFRVGNSGPCTNSAYIFDDSALSSCSNPPGLTQSISAAIDVTQYLGWIYDHISPPVRLSASGSTNLAGWRGWLGVDYTSLRTTNRIDLQDTPNAAPEEVYQSLFFHNGPIEYAENDLLRVERYTVRLHFASLPFASSQRVLQDVLINGAPAAHRIGLPSTPNQPLVLEFAGVSPTLQNVISIRLAPSEPGALTALSGLEIHLDRPDNPNKTK